MNNNIIKPHNNNNDALVQDSSNPSALAMELLQFCTKPSIYELSYQCPKLYVFR